MDVYLLVYVLFRCWDNPVAHMDVYLLVYVLFRCWDNGGAYGHVSFGIPTV